MGGEEVEEWVRERVRCGVLGNVPKLSSAEPDIDNMNQRNISLSISLNILPVQLLLSTARTSAPKESSNLVGSKLCIACDVCVDV